MNRESRKDNEVIKVKVLPTSERSSYVVLNKFIKRLVLSLRHFLNFQYVCLFILADDAVSDKGIEVNTCCYRACANYRL